MLDAWRQETIWDRLLAEETDFDVVGTGPESWGKGQGRQGDRLSVPLGPDRFDLDPGDPSLAPRRHRRSRPDHEQKAATCVLGSSSFLRTYSRTVSCGLRTALLLLMDRWSRPVRISA